MSGTIEPMKRATKAEVSARVEEVLHARLNGAEFHDLQALAVEKEWKVSDSQMWRYVQAADKLIEQRFEQDRDRLFRRHVFQRRALYARALQDGDYRTGLAILKDEADLHGLYAPKRHELTGRNAGPVQLHVVEEIVGHEHAAPRNVHEEVVTDATDPAGTPAAQDPPAPGATSVSPQ
jgi:hypothetical protein